MPGAVLSAAGLLVLVWSITESPHRGWTSPAALTGFAAAALLLAAFVRRQLHAPAPMLPLSLLRVPAIGVAAAALALMSFAMFGALFVLTLYLRGVLGFSPWQAGLRTLPLPAGLALGAVCAVPVRARLGGRVPVVGGLALVTVGFAILATTTPDSDYPHCAAFQLVAGFGAGLVAAAATESVMGSVATERAGLGSAINDATRQVGSALGVAVQGSSSRPSSPPGSPPPSPICTPPRRWPPRPGTACCRSPHRRCGCPARCAAVCCPPRDAPSRTP